MGISSRVLGGGGGGGIEIVRRRGGRYGLDLVLLGNERVGSVWKFCLVFRSLNY